MTKVAPERYYVVLARWFAILCVGYAGYIAMSSWLRNRQKAVLRRHRQVSQTISYINAMKRYRGEAP
jgi:type II secretory pathway pseudopilin PulG